MDRLSFRSEAEPRVSKQYWQTTVVRTVMRVDSISRGMACVVVIAGSMEWLSFAGVAIRGKALSEGLEPPVKASAHSVWGAECAENDGHFSISECAPNLHHVSNYFNYFSLRISSSVPI
jgi:hypothetical protein